MNVFTTWPIIITYMGSIIHIIIIHNSRLVDIGVIIIRPPPVLHAVRFVHVLRAYKYPPA